MSWTINGQTPSVVPSLTLTARSLTLSIEVTDANIHHWRQYDRSGDYRESSEYGGGWELVDDQGRADSVTVTPPSEMRPPLDTFEGFIQSYNEQQLSASRYGIDLTVQRLSERTNAYPVVNESGGAWTLGVSNGTLALNTEQVSRAGQRGSTTGGAYSVSLFVSDVEAGALADSWGVPGAVTNRSVGDGEDFPVDTSPGKRQSIILVAPNDATMPSGEYVIRDWQLSRNVPGGRRRWQVETTMSLVARTPTTGEYGGSEYGYVQY